MPSIISIVESNNIDFTNDYICRGPEHTLVNIDRILKCYRKFDTVMIHVTLLIYGNKVGDNILDL